MTNFPIHPKPPERICRGCSGGPGCGVANGERIEDNETRRELRRRTEELDATLSEWQEER
jgi:hypothetical protein